MVRLGESAAGLSRPEAASPWLGPRSGIRHAQYPVPATPHGLGGRPAVGSGERADTVVSEGDPQLGRSWGTSRCKSWISKATRDARRGTLTRGLWL